MYQRGRLWVCPFHLIQSTPNNNNAPNRRVLLLWPQPFIFLYFFDFTDESFTKNIREVILVLIESNDELVVR